MSNTNRGLVTVFGGSGFVGKHAVRALVKDGWRVRVATRSPHTEGDLKVIGAVGQIQLVQANLRFPDSVARALDGADAVVNLVSVLFEAGRQTFTALNVEGVRTIASAAKERGIKNVVHISSIGADPDSEAEYSETKGEGERVLREIIPGADILRPSIIFGPEDNFFNKFAAMAQIAPALPLIGGGETKFQPVYVADVAAAIAACLKSGTSGQTYELGGPQTYSFKELLQFTLDATGRKRLLAPLPWPIAGMVGFAGEISGYLPFVDPFLTRDQVENLKVDNVVTDGAKTISDLGITPEALEAIVPAYLVRFKKYGQFSQA